MGIGEFAPRGPWRNGHLQSMVSSFKLRRPLVTRRARKLMEISRAEILDCGDGVRLVCLRAPQPDPNAPLAVLIHGWEGSADSMYLLAASARLYEEGFEVCRLQLRDHGQSHALNRGLFHSCRLDEVVGGIGAIAAAAPGRALCLGGFSLGGNFSLRVAARAPAAGLQIARVVAICPVLHPPATLDALENGLWPYNYYFMRKWRRSLQTKYRNWPEHYDIDAILACATMRELTAHLVAEYSDFTDLDAYLNGYSIVGDALAHLEVPALLVAAEDDPIIPVADLDRLATPDALEIRRLAHGGHCGFLVSLMQPSWADSVIAEAFIEASGQFARREQRPQASDAA